MPTWERVKTLSRIPDPKNPTEWKRAQQWLHKMVMRQNIEKLT